MPDDLTHQRLGKGLAALIGQMDKVPTVKPVPSSDIKVAVNLLKANPRNPRRVFPNDELTDLAQSIQEHGIVQPIVVRPSKPDGSFEIIAGERRWRAAQQAGLATVPVLIRDVDDRTALEIAIVENVQRSDLNPVEEASGYQQLIDEHQYTQADLGSVVGKSRSHVANTLRLLKLPEVIRDLVINGSISAGHARTLVTAEDPVALARQIVEEGLSVRQAELLAQKPVKSGVPPRTPAEKDADTLALEKSLSDLLGLRVALTRTARGGEIRISYRTLEQLDEVSRRLHG